MEYRNQEPQGFQGIDLTPDEYAEKRARESHRNATEAQELLSHPKIQSFLATERQRAIRALQRLPMEATHEQYMALKVYFNCLDDFETKLKEYIILWNDEQVKQERRQA